VPVVVRSPVAFTATGASRLLSPTPVPKRKPMVKPVLIEQFHVSLFVPRDVPPADDETIRAALDEPRFRAGLRRAVRAVVRQRPALHQVRVTITR
jgi:hypothetical protein